MKRFISIFIFLFSLYTSAQNEFIFYQVDTLQSEIQWKCDKHYGTLKIISGGFVVNKDKEITGGRFIIDMNSIKNTDMEADKYQTAIMILENTLKNEFFEVKKYPYSIFELEEISHINDNNYKLTGDFTLHGNSICISFSAKIEFKDQQIIFNSETFTIDRTDWGVYRLSPKRPYPDDDNDWTYPQRVVYH
jgi:polyisoprenoid-binding protein YceI